jgi:hypothetical protein
MQQPLKIPVQVEPPVIVTASVNEVLTTRALLRVVQDGLDALVEPAYYRGDVYSHIVALRDFIANGLK